MSAIGPMTGRRATIALALALAASTGPHGSVAQDASAGVVDPCALLTDAEVLDATGAAAVAGSEPASSMAVAGYSQGCTWRLEPAGGLGQGATLTLDLALQVPGGRQLYEGQRAVSPTAPRVAGMGDDAFQGPSGEWYAVMDDATAALQYLAIGVFDAGLRRGGIASRALAWRLMSRLAADVLPVDTPGPVCVAGPGDVSALAGVTFASASGGDLNCLYQGGDASAGRFALDVRLEDAPMGTSDATLDLVALGSGEATTVADLPAWVSDEALWVDLGARLLVVQPMWLPADPTRPMGDILAAVADAIIERLPPALANPTAAPTPMNDPDLASLFPAELKGAPVNVQTVTGSELAAQLGDPARLAPIEAVLTAQGRTVDDLSVGFADLFNADDRSGSIMAIRVRGADAASFGIPLLLALQGVADMPIGQTPSTIAGKDVVELEVPGRDPAIPVVAWAHGDVAWFVEADTCVRYTPESGCEESAVDRPLLEEILGALPG